MTLFKCKMCGGTLEINNNETVATCEYCGTKQTLPKLDDEKRASLYDRANHFRRNNEFDKAMGIYEMILSEDNTDAEAYWSLVLCRYGIEYVDDPATHKKVPTVNRAQLTSIFNDSDYQKAIANADGYQKDIYESEAKAIDEIQKDILAISQKEEPFDIFICYKETDSRGARTYDSVYAQDIYNNLINEGYRVFFSRITLEDKIGSAYEPYIFAALNSAKVMLVIGTSAENMNAVWVKNEWSRYLSIIKADKTKALIPCYKDMNPYDMPEEFAFLQAQDMGKIGFMQDLIRGIKKIISANSVNTVKKAVVVKSADYSVESLLKRAFMFLEDENWSNANQYCDKILDTDPQNAYAYLGKLLAEFQLKKETQLSDLAVDLTKYPNYQKALRFSDETLRLNLTKHYNTAKSNYQYIRKTIDSDQNELDNLTPKYKKSILKTVALLILFAGFLFGSVLSYSYMLALCCLPVVVSIFRSTVEISHFQLQMYSIESAINLKNRIISGTPSLNCRTVKMKLLKDPDIPNSVCCISVIMISGMIQKNECIQINNKKYKVDISVKKVDVNYAVAGSTYNLYFHTDEKLDLKKGDIISYNKTFKLSESEGADSEDESNMKENDYSIVADLIAAGDKIQAIKVLRQTYGLSLSEAKKICDNMQLR